MIMKPRENLIMITQKAHKMKMQKTTMNKSKLKNKMREKDHQLV